MVAVWLRLVVVFELSIRLTLMFSRLVIETLDPLPKDRKCFRMVNGVLVERTIENVLPALKTNSDGLKQVLEEMLKQYKLKQNELDDWKVRTTSELTLQGHGSDIDFDGFTEKEQHSGRAAIDRIILSFVMITFSFFIISSQVAL